ncbi:MAG: hypothetical protein QNI97_15585, partial [Desulfobacterales bacterium]|nr:hypothetical protein [Desulfobacterales bacterium]
YKGRIHKKPDIGVIRNLRHCGVLKYASFLGLRKPCSLTIYESVWIEFGLGSTRRAQTVRALSPSAAPVLGAGQRGLKPK